MTLLNGVRYPPPRLDRRRPGGAEAAIDEFLEGAPPEILPPRVTLWPFAMFETTPNTSVLVSPRMLGPAVLDVLDVVFDNDNTAPRPWLSLGYAATDPGARSDFTGVLHDIATEIMTTRSFQVEGGGAEFQGISGFPKFGVGATVIARPYRLGYLVPLAEFHLVLHMETSGVGTHAAAGYVRVIEQIDPSEIARYL